MGVIKINLPSESFNVRIAGETPTVQERIKINNLIRERSKATQGVGQVSRAQEGSSSVEDKDEQLFDTNSGIQDAAFRAKLSAAETEGDAEKQLRVLYGMTEGDYLRDSRGRLALTPSGGEKIGVELSKPTLIDEAGFSKFDLADFAGVAPEIAGAVAGGIKGAAVGSAAGPLGTVFGGALGAGVGGASGQAIEEGIEAYFGVQDQTAEEVAEDLKGEFITSALTDSTLGLFGLAGRGIAGSLRAGKGLTPDELKTAAESIEMGILPTLSAIRAPSIVGRQQGIVEKVFGSSSRLKQNNEVMQKKIAEFRSGFARTGDEEAGVILVEGSKAAVEDALKKQTEAQQAVISTLRDLGDAAGAAASKNANLDRDVFDILVNARKAFDQQVKAAFKPIDDALESKVAGGSNIFEVDNLREAVKEIEDLEAFGLASGNFKELSDALKSVKKLGKSGTVSFTQLYKLRKDLSDTLARTSFGDETQRRIINDLMRKIDVKLKPANVQARIDTLGVLPKEEVEILMRASGALDPARSLYSEGSKIFEDIETAGIIKNLTQKSKENVSIGVKDVDVSRIIKNDTPEVLERIIKAASYGKSGSAKDAAENSLREELASQWLNDALNNSGIGRVNDFDPTKFKPAAFKKAVDDLGRTADVLFGKEQAKQVRELANQIDRIGLTNLKASDIAAIRNAAGENSTLIDQLRILAKSQRDIYQNQRNKVFSKIASGELLPTDAADYVSASGTKASEIKKIMDVFKDDETALQKIRGNYMERLIADFGETLTTDGKQLGAFAKRLLEADKGGKLSVIFGDTMGKDMAKFARILDFNARTAAGGDLVAANIAASPLENLGKLAKLSILGKVLQFGPYYKQITDDYAKLSQGLAPKEKSRLLGRLISQGLVQQSQEGLQEAESQAKAVMDSSGISQQISQIQQNIPNPNNYSSLGQAAVVPPTASASIPQQPQGTLRQQAKQNPGIAAALGIQGATAGLI